MEAYSVFIIFAVFTNKQVECRGKGNWSSYIHHFPRKPPRLHPLAGHGPLSPELHYSDVHLSLASQLHSPPPPFHTHTLSADSGR